MQPSLELCYNYLFTSQGQGEFQKRGLTVFTYSVYETIRISLILFAKLAATEEMVLR